MNIKNKELLNQNKILLENNNNINNIDLNKKLETLENTLTQLEIENKSIKEQNLKLKDYSNQIVQKIKNESKENEFLIDKRMISSILFKYFSPNTSYQIKESLLETLANFMNYSSNERKELGLSEKTNDIQVGTKNNNKDKLSQLGDELYDFITNA